MEEVNLGEKKEVLDQLRRCYNDILFAETILHLNTEMWTWNVYGPHYSVLRKLFEKMAKKTAKYSCGIARRIRDKGGFTFGINDLKTKPNPVPELDQLPEDKNHHLTETDALKVAVVQAEAIARLCKRMAECCNKNRATADEDYFNYMAIKHEEMAQMCRGFVTPQDLRPPTVSPTNPEHK